ncbi:DDE_3 domain-containing protein [Trichonephila clavipes]|nr:DDE_3 domain-containing protein [Trichonephila clavipes]
MLQFLLPVADGIFQDDNAPINAAEFIQSWFDHPEDEVKHLHTQSFDLTIIEPLWSILERLIRNRCPPPASLPELS